MTSLPRGKSGDARWELWGPGYYSPTRLKVYRSQWRARLRCRWDRICMLERWVEHADERDGHA
jgi:hypothetical protein